MPVPAAAKSILLRGGFLGGMMGAVPYLMSMTLGRQMAYLLLLGLPIACATWTVTHEEVFREPRDFCRDRSQSCKPYVARKFFYLFTCEYCFSHYVTAFFLLLTRFQMLYTGWRGYLIAWFALVWVANFYMSLYNRLRLEIKHENVEIAVEQAVVEEKKAVVGG